MNSSEVVDEHGWGSPVAWPRVPIRSLTRTLFVDGDWIESPYITDSGVRLIQTGNIGIGHYKEQGLRYVSDETFDELRCTEVLPGDVLICRLADPVGRACVAPDLGVRMITSVDVTIVRPKPGVLAEYVALILSTERWLQRLSAMSQGGTRDRIARLKLGELRVPLPDLETQRRIVDVLAAETARIDTLIEKNERVLGLLERRWQSLLENAIFVNASVRRSPLWLACDITPGYAFRSDEFQQAGPVRLLRGINVGVGTVDWSDVVYANEATVAPATEYRLKAGDLVVGMDRPWISSGLRVARISPEDEPAYLVQRVARLRPRPGLDQDYLYLALQSRKFYAAFEPVMTGVSVPHVSGGQIGAFRVPMPDLDAQRRLTAELDVSWQRGARMRAAVDRQQELLRLRRQALITAAVTGQIEV